MQPSQGSVTLLGAARVRDVAHRIGYMGHAPLLYDELSGMENLRYFAGLYGLQDDDLCSGAMRQVGLDPSLERRVGQYSQGMRQRLSLARAVLHDPDLMLLDEPFSNVDVHSAREMAAILGRVRDRGKTILRRDPSGPAHGIGGGRVCPYVGGPDCPTRISRAE